MERPYIQLIVAIALSVLLPLLDKMFKKLKALFAEASMPRGPQRPAARAVSPRPPRRPQAPVAPVHNPSTPPPRPFIAGSETEGGRVTEDVPASTLPASDGMSDEARKQLRNAFIWSEILKRKF